MFWDSAPNWAIIDLDVFHCVSLQRVDIFSKDFLLVPVHDVLHWSLAVVCHPSAVGGMLGPDIKPCILHLDSMQGGLGLCTVLCTIGLIDWWAWVASQVGSGVCTKSCTCTQATSLSTPDLESYNMAMTSTLRIL
jgi:hypothetical protein